METGASSWLSARPLEVFNRELSKSEFTDGQFSECVCGKQNGADHTLSCSTGGYTILRHNEIRDTLADIITHAGYKGVEIEKVLQPVNPGDYPKSVNTAPDARSDVYAISLWRRLQGAHIDVAVFHPTAPSYRDKEPRALYRLHESRKKRYYQQLIREAEKGAFTPFVMSTSGGAGPEAERLIKKLATRISGKHHDKYPETINFIRIRIRFCLLRSTLVSLRGTRKNFTAPPPTPCAILLTELLIL